MAARSQTGYPTSMAVRLGVVVGAFLLAVLAPSCSCGDPVLPEPPVQCVTATGVGCLPDETCVDGACVPIGRCEDDDDCPSLAFRCVFPAQFCELRPGFGEECSAEIPCAAGFFCSLGTCRDVEKAQQCSTRLDCPQGFMCDKQKTFCVEEAPCTFATQGFPEAACDPDETCDENLARCRLPCQEQCEVATELEDCGPGLRCDGACRCVQCLEDTDCGTGLICNVRSGRCRSENLCFTDDDCTSPLVCDPRTQLCQVAPPPCEDDFDCTIAEICNLANGRCELPEGECFDDRFEDADTPARAEDVTLLLGTPKLLDDLVLCPDDDDVYRFTLTAGTTLTATVTRTVPAARATLWLLDSDAETSIGFAETFPRGDGRIIYTAQVDEVVFLRVNALLAQSPYDLDVRLDQGAICAPDFFEGAGGNDTIDVATSPAQIVFDVPLQGAVCPRDTDLYAVDIPAGEGLTATLRFEDATTDLDLALLDSAGLVLERSAGVAQPELVSRRFRDGGRVYVRVRGFANKTGPYTLELNRIPVFVCEDTFEPDDADAREVSIPNVSATGAAPFAEDRSLCGSAVLPDVDRWRVAVEDFERLVAVATPSDPDIRVVLSIHDDVTGALLARSPIGQGASAVSFNATTNGFLQVRAAADAGDFGAYEVALFTENQTSCDLDVAEPNNRGNQLSALPDDDTTLLSICESDEDFFALEGSAGKVAVIDVRFRHADGDLDVQLLGLDGQQVLGVSDSISDNEHLEAILPNDGTYTIRVFSLSSGAKARYTIGAVLESP